jgi:retinol dehydrogenase-12
MSDKTYPFNPATDIPSLSGKVIFITGANTGLGKASALELAKHNPAQVWVTARDAAKGESATDEIRSAASEGTSVCFLQLDLSSFDSIKSAAQKFTAASQRLDILYLNAGVFGCPAGLTRDGYEIQMGINHVGHALLLKLLAPTLARTAKQHGDARAISLSSTGYKFLTKPIPFDKLRTIDAPIEAIDRYMQSKLANLLYAREAAKHYTDFTVVSLHPGEVMTELYAREAGDERVRMLQTQVAPVKTGPISEGVKSQLWAAAAPGLKSGTYYEPVGVETVVENLGTDDEAAKKLWEWTQQELKDHEL